MAYWYTAWGYRAPELGFLVPCPAQADCHIKNAYVIKVAAIQALHDMALGKCHTCVLILNFHMVFT